MAIEVNGQVARIGLALSGGGFRAAAFHLGVLRRLQQLGLLWKLDLLSCVSGGSIAGAYLASRWGDDVALDDLERYLKEASIAVSSVVFGALNPFTSRLDELAKTYDRDLFAGKTLGTLRRGPRLYLNSTNLVTGNLFFFVAGENKPTEMGEWELDEVSADDFPIAKAVAASSAFPPVFPPLVLDRETYPNAPGEYVTLSDGGIYDNLGVNPLLRIKRNDLQYAIVSDAGKPFAMDWDPPESGAGVLTASIPILMEQVRGLQFRRLELSNRKEGGPKPIWFSIDSDLGETNPGDSINASNIRTNLRALSGHEVALLGRHAGALLDHRLRTYAPELRSLA